jgi:ADP-heptose:LPS heptosyltransferase
MELLDCVKDVKYGEFEYTDIAMFWGIHKTKTWADVVSNGFERVLMEANSHLEQGLRLEDWMPDLPCDFHYELHTSEKDKTRAAELLAGLEEPLWGISAASYRGSEAWTTWGYDQWSEFLKAFNEKHGGTIILLGGFWDDLTATLADEGYKDLVGKTSVGCMVEVLKRLKGYIGFSSGMGVLRTVLKLPVFMMWPSHQQPLSTSWAPPWMLEEGLYVAMPWQEPKVILHRVNSWVGEMH